MNDFSSLLILACDHRNSYVKALPGTDAAQLRAGKVLVARALNSANPPAGARAGLLTDLEYGLPAVEELDGSMVSAIAIERSGQAIFEIERSDWRRRLVDLDATYAKVLIRYRADDPDEVRALQVERLREIDEFCASEKPDFLLEIIAPFSDAERAAVDVNPSNLDEVRTPILEAALDDLLERGLNPMVWKVEGLDSIDATQRVATAARKRRTGAEIVVLGAGAPSDVVDRWLKAAAGGGYTGFAVGRSIWAEPLRDWVAGSIDEAATAQLIADRFARFVDVFHAS